MYIKFLFVCVLWTLLKLSVAQYNDIRCRCTCKELVALSIPHKVYSAEASQEDCYCLNVVIPKLDPKYLSGGNKTAIHMTQYCIGCECVYEVRSTKTMEVVVIMYLILIGGLMLYMIGVWIVDALSKKQNEETMEDMEELVSDEGPSTSMGSGGVTRRSRRVLRSTSSGSVVQKISSAREEWKKTVRNQRDQVYEQRNILQ